MLTFRCRLGYVGSTTLSGRSHQIGRERRVSPPPMRTCDPELPFRLTQRGRRLPMVQPTLADRFSAAKYAPSQSGWWRAIVSMDCQASRRASGANRAIASATMLWHSAP
ncbi:hypothetical protein BURKHO8Y_70087 [Burkholderia sp. 8Y]|nr:hypothetical protein BURKHO8Y_70087 [Burkholderia sp. 8Y]